MYPHGRVSAYRRMALRTLAAKASVRWLTTPGCIFMISSVAPCPLGIAMEIGIEPTARHAGDLGTIPVVIEDACGTGHADAAQRFCQALHFAGDATMTDTEAFCAALARAGARA